MERKRYDELVAQFVRAAHKTSASRMMLKELTASPDNLTEEEMIGRAMKQRAKVVRHYWFEDEYGMIDTMLHWKSAEIHPDGFVFSLRREDYL